MDGPRKSVVLSVFIIAALFQHTPFTNGQSSPASVSNRIVNGDVAGGHEFPFLAEIRKAGQHWCGGTILSAQWILTSAFCVLDGPENYQIVLGEHDLLVVEGSEQFIDVSRIFPHPDLNHDTLENDIALVQLADDIRFVPNMIQRVQLEPEGYVEEPQAIVMGWGNSAESGAPLTELHKATVLLVDQPECAAVYNALVPPQVVSQDMKCAGRVDKGPCAGDNGGPLICSSSCGMPQVQCGIVSFGRRCGVAQIPSVYTRVASYIRFIEDTVTIHSRPSIRSEL